MNRRRTRPAFQNKGATLACLGGALVILAGAGATAQEALRSSISYDQAVQPRQNSAINLGPEQSHWGPVQFSLGFYSSVDFEDNINYSENNSQSDAILHGGVNASLTWPATAQSELNLNGGIGYAHYLKNPQYDNYEIAPNSLLNWNVFIGEVSLTFYDQFSYTQDVATQPALSGLVRYPIFDNTIGTRINWTPGKWLFQAGYSHDEYFAGSSAFEYVDRSSEYFFTRGAWRFAENTQAGLEASASLTSYRLAIQPGNYSISVGPFAEWQITPAIRATFRAGPTFYLFNSAGAASQGSSLGSYYAEFEVRHQLTDYVSHELSIQREVSLAVNQGGNYIQQLSAAYSWIWKFTEHISLGASAGYEHGTQTFQNFLSVAPGFVTLQNQMEAYDRYSAGPSLTWQATAKFSTGLSYNYYFRKSNLVGRGYVANSVTLRLNYAL